MQSPVPISPIKATEQTVYMEEETAVKSKVKSKIKFPIPETSKEQSLQSIAWESKIKLEMDHALKNAKDISNSL